MEIKIIKNFENDQNTYVVSENGEALVIDPGCECDKISEEILKSSIDEMIPFTEFSVLNFLLFSLSSLIAKSRMSTQSIVHFMLLNF